MGFDEEIMDGYETIMLTDEDGEETEFAIIDTVELKGESYILVIEADLLEDEDAEAMILKKTAENNGELSYELIEDDDEFDAVADAFAENNDDYDVEIEE